MAAATHVIKGRYVLGDRWVVVTEVSAGVTVTAVSLGLVRIDAAWLQDAGDNASVLLGTYAGSEVVLSAAPSGGTQLLFCLGF
jgi:hypothetical protein